MPPDYAALMSCSSQPCKDLPGAFSAPRNNHELKAEKSKQIECIDGIAIAFMNYRIVWLVHATRWNFFGGEYADGKQTK
jgi:hypothetical protein